MSFNPIQEKGVPLDRQLRHWFEFNLDPYNNVSVPSQQVIRDYVERHGEDYRLETEGPHPIESCRDRSTIT